MLQTFSTTFHFLRAFWILVSLTQFSKHSFKFSFPKMFQAIDKLGRPTLFSLLGNFLFLMTFTFVGPLHFVPLHTSKSLVRVSHWHLHSLPSRRDMEGDIIIESYILWWNLIICQKCTRICFTLIPKRIHWHLSNQFFSVWHNKWHNGCTLVCYKKFARICAQ